MPNVTLVGLNEHVRPVTGDIVSVSATVPVYPLVVDTVIVLVPVWSAMTLTDELEADTSKVVTGTVTVIVAFWERRPLVPVTFTR